ncbi:ABC transporter substrate-binding protein [Faecalicatena orotica]|uniref:ABC transporter substrate-binding protein n=1 Tax=Faecalicatena orotica TaxID=1544 RepID=UPI003217076D
MKSSLRRVMACVCAAGLFCFTGCAGLPNEGEGRGTVKREELVLWTYYETEMQRTTMDDLTAGFNKSQDQYHLTWEYHGPVTEFNKRLAIGMTQNQLPDMVILDNPDMPSYVKMGKLEDITDAVNTIEDLDQYFPSSMESVEYGGRYYGLPFCCNNVALIYNKDMLKEAGVNVPETWEELRAAAEKLTVPGRYGFAMSAISGEQGAFQFGTYMLSAGDDLGQAGGEGTLKAFQYIQDMAEEGLMSRDCVNWSQNDVARTFIAGKCAMMENGPWVFPELDESGINYGIAVFPSNQRAMGLLGGEDIAVLKGKNVEGSIAFLKYYSQIDIMLNANLRANSLPPRLDVAQLFLKAKPEYKVILSQMEHCISRAGYTDWSKLSPLLSDGQYRIITGESTPQEVCTEIRQNMGGEKDITD